MSSERTQNSCDNDNACVVCFKNVYIYSIGICDHPVCFECSTRMRVLCKQNECPICRQNLPKVIFTRKIETFSILKGRYDGGHFQERNFGILFASPSIQAAYYELLSHDCPLCSTNHRRFSFKNFQKLKEHMRKDHELYYCDLCVDNLNIFTFERKCYNRTELAQHRRKGDVDNTSHRGHPLCEFCDQRYMDSDELFRHLRRDHMYCHFCDAEGKHLYYNSYVDLRNHFIEEHYLCEEGECKDQPFVSAFSTDIDFKAHIASVHGKNWSKSANKQARTLELEFTLAPRNRQTEQYSRLNRKPYDKRNDRDNQEGAVGYNNQYNMEPGGTNDTHKQAKPFVNALNPADFPSLGNDSTQMSRPSSSSVTFTSKISPNAFNNENFPALNATSKGAGVTITGKVKTFQPKDFSNIAGFSKAPEVTITRTVKGKSLQKNDENFPALSESSCGSSTVRLSVNGNLQSNKCPNVSIHVNHKANGTITTGTVQVRPPQQSAEAFPALSSAPIPQAQWVMAKAKKQEPKTASKKVAPAPELPTSSLSDFPALNERAKSDKCKKSSSVLVNLNTYNSMTKSLKESNNNNNYNEINNASNNVNKQKHDKSKDNNTNNNNNSVTKSKKGNELKNEINESKSKNNKKKKNKSFENNSPIQLYTTNVPTTSSSSDTSTTMSNQNGVIKKRSELKIEPLEVSDETNKDISLEQNKPPPGFNIKPPPGLNRFNAMATSSGSSGGNNNSSNNKRSSSRANIDLKTPSSPNDLTFTASSGQCYSILPQYHHPPNFNLRNAHLFEKFIQVLKTSESITEFKNYSDLFRKGIYPAEKFYNHCQTVLDGDFDKIFLELLVLLPDIEKQQELYKIHKLKAGKTNLDVCQTCKQVVLMKDLKSHLVNHNLENHFPVLSQPNNNNVNNVWKKV